MVEVVQDRKIVDKISYVHLWRIIREEGYSYKRSQRWITSPDAGYEIKNLIEEVLRLR